MMKHILFTMVCLFSVSALACDLHGQPGFGLYGHMNFSNSVYSSDSEEMLVITLDEKREVNQGDQTTLDIQYTAPLRFRSVIVEFVASEGINIVSPSSVTLDRLRGNISLEFNAAEMGEHNIAVNVSANEEGYPYFAQQNIVINAN